MSNQSPLKVWREAQGHTMAETAALVGVDKATWWRWERRNAPISIFKISDVERITGISRNDLRPDVFGTATEPLEAAE
ncbi:MAG: helix-turn-helix domain-containing protein [bacterium]